MRTLFKLRVFFLSAISLFQIAYLNFDMKSPNASITIKIDNIRYGRGEIFLCLSNKDDDFLETCSMDWQVAVTEKGMTVFIAEGIPPGRYAISAFHDLNHNGELDKGKFLGIPKEPFGFSGNPRIIFGAPDFDDCSFVIDQNDNEVLVSLKEI